jgi:hypothetical protein
MFSLAKAEVCGRKMLVHKGSRVARRFLPQYQPIVISAPTPAWACPTVAMQYMIYQQYLYCADGSGNYELGKVCESSIFRKGYSDLAARWMKFAF